MTTSTQLVPLKPPGPAVTGAVTGGPRHVLRLEGAVLLVAALIAFSTTRQAWWLVPAVLFLPDLAMVGYARSRLLGALTYNLAHSYSLPAILGGWAMWHEATGVQAVAMLWFAHIGLDRLLGYGLKYSDGFTHTHLGTIGRSVHQERPQQPSSASTG